MNQNIQQQPQYIQQPQQNGYGQQQQQPVLLQQAPPQVYYQQSSPQDSTSEFSSTYLTITTIYRVLNLLISLGFLLFGFTLLTKYLGDEATIASQETIKGKKSLFLVIFIYVVFLLIGIGIIPGLVDWAPVLVYLYLGQRKKIVIIIALRFFYFLGLVPQFITIAILVGMITGGVGTVVSALFHVLWVIIMFIQVKGCLFDQISLVLALNRNEEIKETEFAGQMGLALVTFGMINHKYSCCTIPGKTTLFVRKH